METLCFIVKAKVLCLGFQMKYTTRNQWLSYIYNTVPEQFNPNIRVCAAHFMEDCSWSWVRVAYNVNTMNCCEHYKVGQFQRRKDSLTFRYLKNLLLTIQTRVLSSVGSCLFGVSMITNADMVLCMRGAMRKKTACVKRVKICYQCVKTSQDMLRRA